MANVGTEDGARNLPQFGKKGHKPRPKFERPRIDLDALHTNLISYWNKTAGFDSVTKFAWNLIVGSGPKYSAIAPKSMANLSDEDFIPSQVMVIMDTVGPGWAETVDDGVNRGLAHLMAKIRASLSTSNIGYETADLGMLLTSTASIANLIGMAKRLLEARNMWKDRNYVYPRYLIKALGDDYDNICNNINMYSARLNRIIDMYNGMNALDVFDVYGRQYAMAHSIYIDEDSELAQIYAFKHNNYYVYDDETSSCTSTSLLSYTFNNLCTAAEEAINAWYGSSDLYQINGTLLRAFKEAPRQIIPHFHLEDTINPTIDRDFLMQIMNMTIVGAVTNTDITQDLSTQNFLKWMPKVIAPPLTPAGGSSNKNAQMLRLFESDVSQDDNMELTRLLNFSTSSSGSYVLKNCGSEIVTSLQLYAYNVINGATISTTITSNDLVVGTGYHGIADLCDWIAALSPFRYIPCITLYSVDTGGSGSTTITPVGLLGDLYNWMSYTAKDWNELQRVAYQSLWTTDKI